MIEGQFKPFQRLQLGDFEEINPGGLEISLFASATSTAATITWPGSLQSGMVAFLIDHANNIINKPTDVTPSGFTNIPLSGTAQTDGFNRVKTSYKILTGSESGSLTGMDGDSFDRKIMFIIQGTSPIASVTISDATVNLTNSDPGSETISASNGIGPVLVIGSASIGSSATAAFSTESPAFDATVAATRMVAGYKIYNSSPQDHTIDMNDLGSGNALIGFYATFS